AFMDRIVWVGRQCRGANVDGCTSALGQLDVAGDKVGMKMGLDDVADAQAGRRRVREILLHVAARVDNRSLAIIPADQIRSVRQATEIVWLEEHWYRSPIGLAVH